jgi:EAL domain-containing protein (putative c-di-GMP-specific phosphodiesterase class I)/PleD family two-component response regulator
MDDMISNARILIVDDNAANLAVLAELLDMAGYTAVCTEQSARQAVARWQTERFDLLLLDIRMPDMDGHAVMAALRADLADDDYLPCIVLTAQTDAATREAALDAGAIDFITKPFDFNETLKRIKTALNTRLLHTKTKTQLNEFGKTISAQSQALIAKEHDLAFLAAHDSVTGLLNRRAMTERIHQMVREPHDGITCALIEITDADQLLLIEGVESVDMFLRTVATQLKMVIDDHLGLCGLWGGQTFLCVLPFTGDAVRPVFDRLARAVFTSVARFDFDVSLHGRGGYSPVQVAAGVLDEAAIEAAIRRAGFALASLHKRCNLLVEFNQAMADTALRHNLIERELNFAMRQSPTQFFLQFQPKVDLSRETVVGCEALLRWDHPELGWISPAEFIPIAEEKGQIEQLGLIVIEQALQFIQRMQRECGRAVMVAVNVSGYQFELMRAKGGSLVDEIQILLEKYQIDPQYLELEMTESALMSGLDWVIEKLHRLREIGISVALDDFGTGYSSFSYLQKLPITTLKIDRSFVDNAANQPRQAALLGGIVRMAQDLGLTTVAEGVETRADIELLKSFNCPIVQGYYYSRPLMPAAFIALLNQPGRLPPAH